MTKGLERVGVISIESAMKLFLEARKNKLRFINVNGIKIKMCSQRYIVFLKSSGTICKCCGREGKYFAIEKQTGSCEHYHLNLYGLGKKGGETLFTKDHIIPKSLGGRNTIENYQTMCEVCNSKKGSNITEDTLNRIRNKNLNKVMNEECKAMLNLK